MATIFDRAPMSDGRKKNTQTVFKGYDHREGAGDGSVWHMQNMSGDHYPFASSRAPRIISRHLATPNGITGYDGLYYVDGTAFYADGVYKGAVTNSRKRFAFLGSILVILPDKAYYNTDTGEFGSLEASWSGTASFADGTYMGEDAKGCRITTTGSAFPFRAGDAVTITGASNEQNNQTIIIREISEDGKSLGFYEHSFSVASGQTLTITRSVPDMDYICQNENRLFGCKGDTIYASKLGDAYNWNVFDGLATDSYALDVGSPGDFTGCTAFMGFAVFFKENHIYKLYGDKPSNFQAMASASLGVMEGAGDSPAIAGETLYYLSRMGVMAYTGGVPTNISAPFGTDSYSRAVGGSDGMRYYVSMYNDAEDAWSLFCYDTRVRQWYREDNTEAVGFAWYDGLRMLASDGTMYRIGAYRQREDGQSEESEVQSVLEFGDITEDSPDHKYCCKILLRLDLDAGASVSVHASFDGRGYRQVSQVRSPVKQSYYMPLPLQRYDHCRIRINGTGGWKLCSLTREYAAGSEK